LPGAPNAVLYRVREAGWTDVFRLARAPVAEIAYRANLSPKDARTVRDAAQVTILRGIGTAHAARLIGGGISSVPDLAAATPDSVWRLVRDGPRPTLAEVRVWVRAARKQAGATPPRAAPRVAHRAVPAQVRLLELRAATTPIIGGECGDSGGREALGEEARLHRTVHDDPRAVLRTPGDLALGGIATDQRERRLQRTHVPDRLAARQQRDIEVRHAHRADFALF